MLERTKRQHVTTYEKQTFRSAEQAIAAARAYGKPVDYMLVIDGVLDRRQHYAHTDHCLVADVSERGCGTHMNDAVMLWLPHDA